MSRSDVLKIMAVLRGAFPQFYRNISRNEAEDTVSLWEDMFRDDDFVIVAAAVKAYIEADESGFPPTIGHIKGKVRSITKPKELNEGEAWSLVAKAVRNSLYGAAEEFEKLPPAIKRIVHSPSQLREWGMMDSDKLHSVVASNFQRAYRAHAEQEREYDALPNDVKRIADSFAEKYLLSGNDCVHDRDACLEDMARFIKR